MKKNSTDTTSGNRSGHQDSRLEDIFENILECISRIDKQGFYLSVNSRYAETYGYSADEMNGMAWEDTIFPDDLAIARNAYQVMTDCGRSECVVRGIKKNSEQFYQHLVMVRGLDSSGSSVNHYCFMQDITVKRLAEQQALLDRERRAAEEALKRSEQRLHLFTMTSPDPVLLTRLDDGLLIDVNGSFESITGFSKDEVIGRTTLELEFWPNREERQRYIELLKKDGKVQNLEITYRKKDNSLSHALLSATVKKIDGESYICTLARDIQKQKEEQQRLVAINQTLLNLGPDINENIQQIVSVAGQMLKGSYALFNRLEGGDHLHAVGHWNTPGGFRYLVKAEGNPCYELICSGDREARILRDYHESLYVNTNSNLQDADMRTYMGQNVLVDGQPVGTLCVLYDYDFSPSEVDKELLGILASALGREESRAHSDRALVNITRGVSASTGETFFEYLTNYLCISMDADFAIVGCLSEDRHTVHTLAVSEKGKTVNNINCKLENTPWEAVITGEQQVCMCPGGIRQLYPDDDLLRELEIEGYVGAPLRNSRGRTIGFIVVLFKQPIRKERYFHEQSLVIFAARAGAELDRMSSVQALIKSEEKFRDAFGKAPTGICLVDREGNLFQTNRTMLDILGYSEETLLSTNLFDITHPDACEACRRGFRQLTLGNILELKFEERLLSPDGMTVWVNLQASPVFDDNGLFMFAVTHVIDITERVLATHRVERSTRALHVLNDCNHGFARIDNELGLLQYICEVIVSTGKYRMAWVGYCQHDEQRTVEPVAYAGYEDGYLQQLITWADEPRGRGPEGICIRTLQPCIVRNTHTDPAFTPWRDAAEARGYLSCAGFPVRINGVVIGCLLLYAEEEDAFDPEEVSLLQDLTANLARGIQNIRVKADHDKARHELQISEEKFRMAFDNASMGMAIVNCDGVVLEANDSAHHMIGYDDDELIGKNIRDITHPDDLEMSLEHFSKLWTGEADHYRIQKRYIRRDGHIMHTILNASIMKDPDGSPDYMVAMVEDITLRREAELALVESEERFRTLYDDTPSMFFTVDTQGKILSVNEYGARELGYTVQELYKETVTKLIFEDDHERIREHLNKSLDQPDRIHRLEFRKVKKDGHIIWVRGTLRSILDQKGNLELLIVCEDISEIKRLSSQLTWQASHDALTGLVNRVEFERRLERVLESMEENRGEHALCFLDMDQFKIINDSCGHLAGDELLRQLSEVLSAGVRKRDTIARLGGDEFGILMEHCNLDKAGQVANGVLKKVEDFRFMWEGKRFSLGVSIGLVPITGEINSVTTIMKEADAACYAAKDAGRNRVHVYQPDDKSLSRIHGEMQWVSIISEAVEDDNLLLFKQDIKPLFKTAETGKHYEILVRLQANDGHIVLPGAFMPAAERYNLSTRIDAWVIQATLKWLRENPGELKTLSLCCINLSGLSLSSNRFTDVVLDLFREYGIPGNRICFEITETAAIQNMSNAIKFMHMLKEIGCSFALDDFGSGVSSFAYLKQIPVDYIKIDGTFVRDMLTDHVDFEMVRSINDIARVMGIQTIAEFIESEEILRLLQGLGVTYGQGYYIDKPTKLGE